DFKRGHVGSFEHLDSDWAGKAAARFQSDFPHHFDRLRRKWRPDVREIVTVFENDGVHSGIDIMPQIGKRLRDDRLFAPLVSERTRERWDGDHCGKELVAKSWHERVGALGIDPPFRLVNTAK